MDIIFLDAVSDILKATVCESRRRGRNFEVETVGRAKANRSGRYCDKQAQKCRYFLLY